MPDLRAAARVSRHVEVETIRLGEARIEPGTFSAIGDDLQIAESVHGTQHTMMDGKIGVVCKYEFIFHSKGKFAFTLRLEYHVIYGLQGELQPDEEDVRHFADANGRYHTWPFIREMIVSLTAKMGYRPFVLPALIFLPRVEEQPEPVQPSKDSAEQLDEG